MIKYKRNIIGNGYYSLNVFECPKDIILFAANAGSNHVTIENYLHYCNFDSVGLFIKEGDIKITPKILKYDIDFKISRAEFIALIKIWDRQGCYAIFHEKEMVKFKATNLEDLARYKALDNFDWTLELAIPSSASDGWAQITSPKKSLIDEIEQKIKTYINE